MFLPLFEVVRLWPALLFYHRCILNNEVAESKPGGSKSEPPWRMRSSSTQSAVAERLRKSSCIPRLSAECEYLRLSAEYEYPGAPEKEFTGIKILSTEHLHHCALLRRALNPQMLQAVILSPSHCGPWESCKAEEIFSLT